MRTLILLCLTLVSFSVHSETIVIPPSQLDCRISKEDCGVRGEFIQSNPAPTKEIYKFKIFHYNPAGDSGMYGTRGLYEISSGLGVYIKPVNTKGMIPDRRDPNRHRWVKIGENEYECWSANALLCPFIKS